MAQVKKSSAVFFLALGVLLLCLFMVPGVALAGEDEAVDGAGDYSAQAVTADGFQYRSYTSKYFIKTISITGYKGSSTEVVIPAKIDGGSVVRASLINCGLTKLDLSQCTALEELDCSGNNLTSLDLSKSTRLQYLWCSENRLTKLDISKNTDLRILNCQYNYIKDTSALEKKAKELGNNSTALPQYVPTSGATSYKDVSSKHWAAAYIEEARIRGFMTGDSKGNTFRPDDSISRAEVVAALWKAAGQPSVSNLASFTDLTGDWYQIPIAWAEQKKVTTGYTDGSGRFGPDDPVTREQFATLMARYAKTIGKDTAATNTSKFESMPDKGKVSTFAVPAMKWAIEQGIISGVDNKWIAPTKGATRAEVATMMVRAKAFITK